MEQRKVESVGSHYVVNYILADVGDKLIVEVGAVEQAVARGKHRIVGGDSAAVFVRNGGSWQQYNAVNHSDAYTDKGRVVKNRIVLLDDVLHPLVQFVDALEFEQLVAVVLTDIVLHLQSIELLNHIVHSVIDADIEQVVADFDCAAHLSVLHEEEYCTKRRLAAARVKRVMSEIQNTFFISY